MNKKWQVTVRMFDGYIMDEFVLHNMNEQDAIAEVVEIIDGDDDVDTFTLDEIKDV